MNYSNIVLYTSKINEVFNLYRNFGENDYIGESVTQLEHAMQCAHYATEEFPDNAAIILGAFLHDVGHMVLLKRDAEGINIENDYNNLGALNHETVGYNYLTDLGFPEEVTSLGQNHVLTKRYLVSKYEDYYNKLSDASKQTLVLQGGKLTEEEIKQFERNPNKDLYIKMRNWDDKAKQTDFNYQKSIDYYEDMAIKLLIC